MPRKKKTLKFSHAAIAAVLIIGTWIAADYYFNFYRHSPKVDVNREIDGNTDTVANNLKEQPNQEPEEVLPEVVSSDGFATEIYNDSRYGIEFQYPVYSKQDLNCPVLNKTDSGFSIGIFSLTVSQAEGDLDNFINEQLEGMLIEKDQKLTVAGQAARQVDYQTQGMGWYGSDTYFEYGGKFYDFGILANATPGKCGGIDDYEDRVYQSVISTLKFIN